RPAWITGAECLEKFGRFHDTADVPRAPGRGFADGYGCGTEDFQQQFPGVRLFHQSTGDRGNPDSGTIGCRPQELSGDGIQMAQIIIRYGIGGILADDMGLGKTLQTITYVLSEMEDGTDRPFLIVTPASLTYNWKNELDTFAPDTEATVVAGNAAERKALLESDDRPDVYITTYHTLRQDLEHYRMTFHAMILDEAQAIKNHRTKIAQAVRSVSASRRFALSGTPVENSVDELWSVFQAIMPGFLPDLKAFRSTPPETISRLVRPFIMRRVKEDVLTELPDKIETVHYTE